VSRTFIPVGLRRLIHEQAAGRCEYCGMPEALASQAGNVFDPAAMRLAAEAALHKLLALAP
jgi:hypothetical protein